MAKILPQETFNSNKELKNKYGSYENYKSAMNGGNGATSFATTLPAKQGEQPVANTLPANGNEQATAQPLAENNNANGYTMNDVASVAETGELPAEQPKSAYDTYMDEAKRIYNEGVEANNKSAANQAAIAGAQYRELNRNVGEINKANGKADTGYAGDASIAGYNAYRNSVNESYSSADSANNQLYSYYLDNMAKLQQAKDTKEATDRQLAQTDRQLDQTDRQLDIQENATKDQKALEVADNIEVLKGENPYDTSGYITDDTAKRLWDYVTAIYGDEENIPAEIMANLNSEKGFAEWLAEYNNQVGSGETGGEGTGTTAKPVIPPLNDTSYWGDTYYDKRDKLESLKGTMSDADYAKLEKELQSSATAKNTEWSIQGLGTGRENDDVDITINGTTYDLLCGAEVTDSATKSALNKLATGDTRTTPSTGGDSFLGNWGGVNSGRQPGKLVVYNGQMYLYTLKGWRVIKNDNNSVSLDKCIDAFLKNQKG